MNQMKLSKTNKTKIVLKLSSLRWRASRPIFLIGFLIGIFLVGTLETQTLADGIDASWLYDTDSLILEKYHPAISSATAYSLRKSRGLTRLYQQSLLVKDQKTLGLNSGVILAEDPVAVLVNSVFYMIPGDPALRVSSTPHVFSSKITPRMVSVVIDTVLLKGIRDEIRLSELIQEDFFRGSVAGLQERLIQGENREILVAYPKLAEKIRLLGRFDDLIALQKYADQEIERLKNKNIFREISRLDSEAAKLEKTRDHQVIDRAEKASLSLEIDKVRARVRYLRDRIGQSHSLVEEQKKYIFLRDILKVLYQEAVPLKGRKFAQIFLSALKRCESPESPFSPYFPFQILMARALLQAPGFRQTLLDIWSRIPEVLTPEGRKLIDGLPEFDRDAQKAFLSTRRSEHSWEAIKESISKVSLHSREIFESWRDRKLPNLSQTSDVAQETHDDLQKETNEVLRYLYDPERLVDLSVVDEHMAEEEAPLYSQNLDNTRFFAWGIESSKFEVDSSDCCEATIFSFFSRNWNYVFPPSSEVGDLLRMTQNGSRWPNPQDSGFRRRLKEIFSNREGLTYLDEVSFQGKSWKYNLAPTLENFFGAVQIFTPGLDLSGAFSAEERLDRICRFYGCEFGLDEFQPSQLSSGASATLHFKSETVPNGLKLVIGEGHCRPEFLRARKGYKGRVANIYVNLDESNAIENSIVNLSAAELERLSHVVSGSYITASENEILGFVGRIIKLVPHFSNYVGPILYQTDLSNAADLGDVANLIFERRIKSLYPLALHSLMKLPVEEHSIKEAMWALRSILTVQREYKDGKYFPSRLLLKLKKGEAPISQPLVDDLSLLLRRLISDPKVNKTLVQKKYKERYDTWAHHAGSSLFETLVLHPNLVTSLQNTAHE